MQLQNRTAYISLFTAAAISLFVIETFIPRPVPGIRLGLANIFILLVLVLFGFKEAMMVGMFKVIAGNLLIGRLLTPSFIFSISGTIMSVVVMYLAEKYGKKISFVGISILGAEAHTTTQVLLASRLFLGNSSFLYLLSPFVILSLITGSITGVTAYWLYLMVERRINFA
ncbi:Gx transporter family protein [candidate division WOR-3 bacterium]|nr:Gx transporter family protein [candidate division WOR-3 bacterium]MCK4527336.1 Gx transporter family protein [candidate division WOR-3 bacterium]